MTSTKPLGALEHDSALSLFVGGIGVWFLATAAIWNRTTAGRANAIAVGLACLAIALAARTRPAVRWLHVPLALWLFATVWLVPYERHFAVWNNVGIGIALLLIPFASLAFAERGRASDARP